MAIISAITAAVTLAGAALSAVGGAIAWTVGFAIGFAVSKVGITLAIIFGGMALSKSASGGGYESPISTSPTYGSGVIQTQTNNNLPIPLIYGTVKCAGNRLWQNDSGESTIKRLVAFGYGEISGFSGIKLNDNDYDDSVINATVTQYTGTSSQVISSLIPGATNAERAEVVGGLKNIAYLAIEVSKSDKVNENYNLTAVVQGLKVNQYTDEDTYTNAYSNNTAWCLLDLLTNYNGLRLGRDSDNTFDNDLLKEIVDIQSFIDAADYCDDLVGYYATTTALTGDNNDLIWQGRASGDNGITITYVDPGTGHATATIALDVDNNIVVTLANPSGTITTTANDIIDLVNNDSDIAALVRVMSADGNDGTGVVTALSEQALTLDEAVIRYTFNMIFDNKFSIRDAVEEFKLNCNGAFVVKDGKLQFKIDKPGTSVQSFTTKDIKRGTLKEWFEPRGDRYDVLKVEYIDHEYDYSKIEAHIERTTPFNTPIIDHKIQCYSVNNFFHASRLGKMYMRRSELCPRFISFTTGMQAVGRQIGDVITLTYTKGSTTIFDAKLFKIYMMVDNQKGELEIYCREYDARIYNDELGSVEPVINQIVINPEEKLRTATYVIAAADSENKQQADFVVSEGDTSAQDLINTVIDKCENRRVVLETGSLQAGSTSKLLILSPNEYDIDEYYNGMYIRFTSGDCAEEGWKLIEGWNKATSTATVGLTALYSYEASLSGASVTLNAPSGYGGYDYGLPAPAAEDDFYNDMWLRVPSLTGSDYELKQITDYNGTTKVATVDSIFTSTATCPCIIGTKDEFINTPAEGDAYEICIFSGKIVLLDGNFHIDGPIKLIPGIAIEGMGASTKIISKVNYSNEASCIIDDKKYSAFSSKYRHCINRLALKDFEIYGENETLTALHVEGSSYCKYHNIKAFNCSKFLMANGQLFLIPKLVGGRNDICNNIVLNKKYIGISVSGDYNKITNNSLHGGSQDLLEEGTYIYNFTIIVNGSHNIISSNLISYATSGIYLFGMNGTYGNVDLDNAYGTNNLVDGNVIKYMREAGIYCFSDNTSCLNNIINETVQNSGIYVIGDKVNISTNFLQEIGGQGIRLGSSTTYSANNCTVDANKIHNVSRNTDNASSNIFLAGNSSYNVITNNLCRAAASGNIAYAGLTIYGGTLTKNFVHNNDLKGTSSYGSYTYYDGGTSTDNANNRTT